MSVTVKICSGTACYIMGGAELLSVGNALDFKERAKVVIEASNCLGECNDYGPETPYATVNGEVLSRATPEILLEKIREALAAEEASND